MQIKEVNMATTDRFPPPAGLSVEKKEDRELT